MRRLRRLAWLCRHPSPPSARSATPDRWADLAVATWSLDWNYGPGWQSVPLEAYGVEPDPLRIAYYRLLWDLSP